MFSECQQYFETRESFNSHNILQQDYHSTLEDLVPPNKEIKEKEMADGKENGTLSSTKKRKRSKSCDGEGGNLQEDDVGAPPAKHARLESRNPSMNIMLQDPDAEPVTDLMREDSGEKGNHVALRGPLSIFLSIFDLTELAGPLAAMDFNRVSDLLVLTDRDFQRLRDLLSSSVRYFPSR